MCCVLQNRFDCLIGHPRICEHLLHTAAHGEIFLNVPCQVKIKLIYGVVECGGDASRLEIVIAVHSADFFHNIGFHRNVAGRSPGRHNNMHIVAVECDLETEQLQFCLVEILCHITAQSSFKPGQADINFRLFNFYRVNIFVGNHLHFRVNFLKQLHCQIVCNVASLRVDSFFVSGGSVGTAVVSLLCSSDTCRLKVGNFENNLCSGIEN